MKVFQGLHRLFLRLKALKQLFLRLFHTFELSKQYSSLFKLHEGQIYLKCCWSVKFLFIWSLLEVYRGWFLGFKPWKQLFLRLFHTFEPCKLWSSLFKTYVGKIYLKCCWSVKFLVIWSFAKVYRGLF